MLAHATLPASLRRLVFAALRTANPGAPGLPWIPLRQRPGLGTILNAIVIGVAIGAILGGTVGIGTLAFALLIGPAVQASVVALAGRPLHEL